MWERVPLYRESNSENSIFFDTPFFVAPCILHENTHYPQAQRSAICACLMSSFPWAGVAWRVLTHFTVFKKPVADSAPADSLSILSSWPSILSQLPQPQIPRERSQAKDLSKRSKRKMQAIYHWQKIKAKHPSQRSKGKIQAKPLSERSGRKSLGER